jgi:hypothetical protein
VHEEDGYEYEGSEGCPAGLLACLLAGPIATVSFGRIPSVSSG